MKKLSLFLSRKTLLTICKSLVKPDSDYADIIYDKTFNEPFKTKIEMIQYRAAFLLLRRLRVHHMIVFFKELAKNLWQIEDGLVRYFSTIKL